jgi:hypothetical protein
MSALTDSLAATGIRCYEVFRDGAIAFEREGKLCFGPSEKLSAFFSGSSESFLTGQAAQTAIAQLRKGDRPFRSPPPVSAENDGLATTRKRWERERDQWTLETSRTSATQQLKDFNGRPFPKA